MGWQYVWHVLLYVLTTEPRPENGLPSIRDATVIDMELGPDSREDRNTAGKKQTVTKRKS